MTVIVASGDAARWGHLSRVALGPEDPAEQTRDYEVERIRTYRDRLVLKLRCVDDPGAAETLRGFRVLAHGDEVPDPGQGRHYMAWLVGLEVVDLDSGERLGHVVDVTETGGCDLLVVEESDGHELLVPVAAEIVREVDQDGARIAVRLPEGLRDLNR